MDRDVKRRFIGTLFLTGFILAFGTFIYLARIPCIFSSLSGLYCAGCGTGRMLHSLLQLDFRSAFAYNPFMMVFLPITAVFFIAQAAVYVKKGTLFSSVPAKGFLLLVILLGLLYSVMRNLSAFSYLAPISY